MNAREAAVSALVNLAAHKLRSVLTMLGVIFGVGAVIAMLSIGAGAEQQTLEMIEKLGIQNVLVRAKTFSDDELDEIREKSVGLSMRDIDAIRTSLPGVALAAPKVRIDPYQVLADRRTTEATLIGVSEHHAQLMGLELARGRAIDAVDVRQHEQVALIGSTVRQSLFGADPGVGRMIKVDDVWLRVVGVLAGGVEADASQGINLESPDELIYVPITTALRKFERRAIDSPLTEIIVRIADDQPLESTVVTGRLLDQLLDRLHAGTDDYEVVVPQALLEQSRRTQRLFNLVMGSIAGISLLVGGIGIMNIMLATVLERTREIGVRRAVGARKRDILLQFLVESFTIAGLGGIAGVILGVAIAKAIAFSAGWPTLVTVQSVALATIVSLLVGVLSGLYPARRAAELDPIESLRYE